MRLRLSILTLGLAFAQPGPAVAQASPDPAADRETIEACLSRAEGNPRECVGRVSTPCMEEPDGSTTVGMVACIGREHAAFDAILNARYKDRVAEAKAIDADSAQGSLGASDAADRLVTAQRAWIAFRDAECDRIAALHAGGSIRGPATASCLNDLTATRAIQLADPGR